MLPSLDPYAFIGRIVRIFNVRFQNGFKDGKIARYIDPQRGNLQVRIFNEDKSKSQPHPFSNVFLVSSLDSSQLVEAGDSGSPVVILGMTPEECFLVGSIVAGGEGTAGGTAVVSFDKGRY